MSKEELAAEAAKLARAIQAYSNTAGEQLVVDFDYYGCAELGWVCRIEVK